MPPSEPLGRSEPFLRLQEAVSRAARVNRPVLLVGERGTGKELAARKIHYLSGRWQAPYLALNCAALAPSLITSELFGAEAGAFTGADRRRQGRFEAAHEGTLLLDEIGLIPMEAQEMILRVVEYGSFERVGGSRPVEVDVRLVAATNADLPALARSGRFKADLLDRLSFEVIRLPPLRERGTDILLLARHFAGRMALELGLDSPPPFPPEVARALLAHSWPGNVRELKNVVERAVYRAQTGPLRIELDPFAQARPDGPDPVAPATPETSARPAIPASGLDLRQAVADLEVSLMSQALARCRHNQRQAAKLLGLTYDQWRGLYKKHHLALAPPAQG